ncbi:MAG: hypothetical protein AABW92_00870 [Nanoarchaeota archaeon]
MFVDVCFPKNNEKEFLDVAEKLSIDGLLFIYDNDKEKKEIKHDKIKIFNGYTHNVNTSKAVILEPLDENISKRKNIIYIYLPEDESPKFHFPLKKINQVLMKELKLNNKLVGLSFGKILAGKTKDIEKISFIDILAKKYEVNVFFASFACSPHEIRSKNDLIGVCKTLGFSTAEQKLSALGEYLSENKNF